MAAGGHFPPRLQPRTGGTVPSLPPVIDIRDDLNRAERETGPDADAEFETVRDRLDAFENRDAAAREGVLDEIDNQLLRLEERLDGEASRRIAAARNRIHVYRDSLDRTAADLSIVETTARDRAEREASDEDREEKLLPVGDVTITLTVANSGDDREVVPVVTIYDEDGDDLGTTRGPAVPLEAGAQRRIELDVDVPSRASYYAAAVEAVDSDRGQDPDESGTDAVT